MFSGSFRLARVFVLAAVWMCRDHAEGGIGLESDECERRHHLSRRVDPCLRSQDYPLPAAYNSAFDSSTSMAMEVDEKAVVDASRSIAKAGEYREMTA